MIDRESVSSSTVASFGYVQQTETLEVEFLNGTIYQYYNIGADVYEQLKTASSKGQFLNAYIRNSYPYSRVG
jgi:hypothetical protein